MKKLLMLSALLLSSCSCIVDEMACGNTPTWERKACYDHDYLGQQRAGKRIYDSLELLRKRNEQLERWQNSP